MCIRDRYSDAIQFASRAALEPLASAWTELRDDLCLSLPQDEAQRKMICKQLLGSIAVTWTSECLVALHLRRWGVQLNLGGDFGMGHHIRPSNAPPAAASDDEADAAPSRRRRRRRP